MSRTYNTLEGETVIWQNEGQAIILSRDGNDKIFIIQDCQCVHLEISTLKQILKELK